MDLGYRPDQPPDLLQDRLQQYDPLYRPRGDRLRENGLPVPSAGPEPGAARAADRYSGVRRRLRSVFGGFFMFVLNIGVEAFHIGLESFSGFRTFAAQTKKTAFRPCLYDFAKY